MPRLHPDQIAHTFAIYTGAYLWRQGLHEAIELHDPAMIESILTHNPDVRANDWHIATLVSSDDHAGFLKKARFVAADKSINPDLLSSTDKHLAFYDARDQHLSADDFIQQQLEILRLLRSRGADPCNTSTYNLDCSDKPLSATEAFSALAFHNVANYDLKAALVMEALYICPAWAPTHELASLFANMAGDTPAEEAAGRRQLHMNAAHVGLAVAERLAFTPEIAITLSPAAQKFWQRTPDEWAALESQMPRPTAAGRAYFAAHRQERDELRTEHQNAMNTLDGQLALTAATLAKARGRAKPS